MLKPWIAQHGGKFWEYQQPVIILVPDFAWIYSIKQAVLKQDDMLCGIQIVTPGMIRKQIAESTSQHTSYALYEDLQLLMHVAANNADFNTPDTLRLLKQDTDSFLEAWDQITACGWGKECFEQSWARQTAVVLEKLLQDNDILTSFQADRQIWSMLQKMDPVDPLFEAVFVCGFESGHWPLMPLLKSVLSLSVDGTMAIPVSFDQEQIISWLGTWEEILGEAQYVEESDPRESSLFFATLSDSFLSGLPGDQSMQNQKVRLMMAGNKAEEAEIIAWRVLEILEKSPDETIGIICPAQSIPAREVAAKLNRWELPFNDAHGHYPAPGKKQVCFNNWILWQQTRNISSFMDFIKSLQLIMDQGHIPPNHLEKGFNESFEQCLTDHFEVNAAWIKKYRPESTIGRLVREWPLLPPTASLDQFLSMVLEWLHPIDYAYELSDLHSKHPLCQGKFTTPVSRDIFLQWLKDILRTPGKCRLEHGSEPFANIQLLSYEQSGHQKFHHLILSGLNQGHFPVEFRENSFLPDSRKKILNNSITGVGIQGEGQSVVHPDYGLMPTVNHKRADATIRLATLMESALDSITVTATSGLETAATSSGLPGEFYLKIAYALCGQVLSDREFLDRTVETRSWLESIKVISPSPPFLKAKKYADIYRLRRDPDKPFGEYEFSYKTPPADGLHFSSKTWENILRTPAHIWFSRVIKVQKQTDFESETSWPLITGNWVHLWLKREPLGIFSPKPEWDDWSDQANEKARITMRQVQTAWMNSGKGFPDWWTATWEEARHQCREIIQELRAMENWNALASELPLPQNLELKKLGNLPLSGRIDLILARNMKSDVSSDQIQNFVSHQEVWIIDFKTGSRAKPLNIRETQNGQGLQLILYALALEELHASEASISILGPGMPLQPQLRLENLKAMESILSGIQKIQKTGIVGMHGVMRSDYSYTGDFPIATLPVSKDILKAKWRSTHPLLSRVLLPS